jgi:tetratricopeptide (TPR) repeat protein
MSSDRAAQLVEAGIWLKLSGDREGARKLFERALKLDPGNEKATQLLAGAPAPGEELTPAREPPPPPVIPSSIGSHPFEPQDTSPAPGWGPAGISTSPSGIVDLEDDWGRMTGARTPVPQPDPTAPVEPGPYTSSPSNVVLGASPVPGPPKSTLVFGPSSGGERPAAGRSGTMQLFPKEAPAPRQTLQLFGDTETPEEQPARTIEIGGDAGPEVQPSSTPPLFGYSPHDSQVVTRGGLPTPSPSTPPLFASLQTQAPAVRSPEPVGNAWAWSSSSPPPKPVDMELTPVPRPSPSLAPRAESAWDQRSNPGIKLEAVVGQDRALDLISSDSKVGRSPEARKEEIRAILRGARDLLDLDDHSGAMELILKAQDIAPDDPEVILMRERSEKTLLIMFESKLGKPETIPRVLLKDDEIIWLNLDHRAGFVLAQIDGTVSFDDLFSVSGMSRIDTARILAQLVEEGVISRG